MAEGDVMCVMYERMLCSNDGKNNLKDFGGCAATMAATVLDQDTWHVSWKMTKSFQNKLENFQLLCGLLERSIGTSAHKIFGKYSSLAQIQFMLLHVLRVKSIKPFAVTCLKICTAKRVHTMRLY